MVRCEQFYKEWEKKGNFCGKSYIVAKRVEEYIDYVRRNKIGTFKISHCALDPFISIEFIKDGRVHALAIKELKSLIKKEKIMPEKITKRFSVEVINKANNRVGEQFKLDNIPNVRNRMNRYEHDISEIEHEVRSMFNSLKEDIGAKNNNDLMRIMIEWCVRNPDGIKKLKEEMDKKDEAEQNVEILAST